MNFAFLVFGFLLLAVSRDFLLKILFKISGPRYFSTVYFLIFLPGIAIHELAHFLMASLLLVPTGEISLFPEGERIGSIEIAKTDAVRQAFIGLAPLLIGTALILAIFSFANPQNLLFLYLIFIINNTMFTSKSDRRSWLGAIALFAFIAGLVYLLGIWPLVSQTLLAYADTASQHIGQAYFFTFLVNLGFILPLYLIEKIRYNI